MSKVAPTLGLLLASGSPLSSVLFSIPSHTDLSTPT